MASKKGRGGRGVSRSARKRATRTGPHPLTVQRRVARQQQRQRSEDELWDDFCLFGIAADNTTRCMLFQVSANTSRQLEDQCGRPFPRGSFAVSSGSCRTQIDVYGPTQSTAEAQALAAQHLGPMRWTWDPPDEPDEAGEDLVDVTRRRPAELVDRAAALRALEEATRACRTCGVEREEVSSDALPPDFPAATLASVSGDPLRYLRCPQCAEIGVVANHSWGAFAEP